MNEKINIAEILEDAPRGTKLWSPICGECELVIVDTLSAYPIKVSDRENGFLSFLSDGRYVNCIDGECLLFPSKDNRDWSTFIVPCKHKHFEPFQKVLITIETESKIIWYPAIYAYYNDDKNIHQLLYGGVRKDNEIIPYKGNENKLLKSVE